MPKTVSRALGAAAAGAGLEIPRHGPARGRAPAVPCLLLAALLAGCSPGRDAARGAGAQRRGGPIPVATVEAQPRDLERSAIVTGQVEPIRTVLVNALAAGTVLRVLVEEGDRVSEGQLLAELDAREVSAQLKRAEAVLANGRAIFERSEQLRARDLASDAELDAARSALETARADAELWRTRHDFTQIAAPVSGVIIAKRVERGGAVSANQTVFEIADDATLVVRVRVSELDVVSLSPGREVALQLDAYPDARIRGRIRRIFPSVETASRLVPVEVVLGRVPRDVDVRPGFLARIEFVLERRRGALAVPASAVGVHEGRTFVYVVSADTVSRRPVETGLTASGWVEISRGLAAGEPVVSSGHMNLRPGAAVRVGAETPAGAGSVE